MKNFELRNRHFDRLVNATGIRWLGQNTNHFPNHPDVHAALRRSIEAEEYHIYAPPAGLEELRALVAQDLGLGDLSVLITDGAVEGLYHVCHTLLSPGDEFITTDPSWAWPMHFSAAAGAQVTQIPIFGQEHGFRLDPDRLRDAVTDRTRMIYLVDPNNPIGCCCTEAEIAAIVEIARGAGAFLVQDCTYRDFAFDHHLAARLYPERTITTWSFSKWLGFAGLRVGALVAHPDVLERLAKAPPNNLGSNIVSQRGAIAGLRSKTSWFPMVLDQTRRNQHLVHEAVSRTEGLDVPEFPSNGNFLVITCEGSGARPEAICAALNEKNIMVRQGAYHTETFGHRFIKVSVSVPEDWVAAFCEALPDAMDRARGNTAEIALF